MTQEMHDLHKFAKIIDQILNGFKLNKLGEKDKQIIEKYYTQNLPVPPVFTNNNLNKELNQMFSNKPNVIEIKLPNYWEKYNKTKKNIRPVIVPITGELYFPVEIKFSFDYISKFNLLQNYIFQWTLNEFKENNSLYKKKLIEWRPDSRNNISLVSQDSEEKFLAKHFFLKKMEIKHSKVHIKYKTKKKRKREPGEKENFETTIIHSPETCKGEMCKEIGCTQAFPVLDRIL